MNHIMAVCDEEDQYAVRLTDYLNMKEDFPFSVRHFSTPEKISEFSKIQEVDVALISEQYYEAMKDNPSISQLIILNETGKKCGFSCNGVYKYQSCENMIKEILRLIAEGNGHVSIMTRKKGLEIIGLYSPVKRCLQTSFAFALGQLLAKKSKVLYLNLEGFSGLTFILKKHFSKDLSDLLYFMKTGREGFPILLKSVSENIGGLDILPPMLCQMDLVSIEKEDWISFLKKIEEHTDYDYLILDLSDCVQGLFDILRQCDYIYSITGNDGFAMAKAEQYKKMLQQCQYDDVAAKTKSCSLPQFSYLPNQLEQMGVSELAKYIKTLIQEDLHVRA